MSGIHAYGRDAVARLEEVEALDPLSAPVQAALKRAIPDGTVAKDVLSGTWLGHPLHPLLTDVVVGSWTCAWLLDLLGGDDRHGAAGDLVGVGVVAALPAAASGLSDWADTRGEAQRVGTFHAAGNTVALALHAASWIARRRGRRGAGVALSTLGLATASASAWLGGHLAYAKGVGVDQTAFEEPPSAWTSLIDDEKLEEGALVRRSASGTGVLLVRHRGKVHAMIDRCSHRGCSLSEGALEGAEVVCACHGSRFGLDGRLLAGPASGPQPALETRVRDGRIEVRAPASEQ